MQDLLLYIDYIGTFVFAITGATIAAKSDFDFFGMLFLAFLTAVGGGTVRDIILDQQIFWTDESIYLYIIIAATIVSFFYKLLDEKLNSIIFFLDTLGLGLFAISGTQKALMTNVNIETALIMGVISGVLGGILRSLFNNETPIIFKNEIYATSAAMCSLAYISLRHFEVSHILTTLIPITLCILVRYISVKYNIHLPKAL